MPPLLFLPVLLLFSSVIPSIQAGCSVPISLPGGRRAILDLSPFLDNRQRSKREISYSAHTPPSLTTYTFAFGTCDGGIGHDGTLEDIEQCPPSSLICLTALNTRPAHRSEPGRITSVVAVAASLEEGRAELVSREGREFADIRITLKGESFVNVPQETSIDLRCDPNSPEPSDPTFVSSDPLTGKHKFRWTSRLGCLDLAKVVVDEEEEKKNEGSPIPMPGKGQEEEEEGQPKSRSRSPALLFIAIALGAIAFLALSFLSVQKLLERRSRRGGRRGSGGRRTSSPQFARSSFPSVQYVVFAGEEEGEEPATHRTPLLPSPRR